MVRCRTVLGGLGLALALLAGIGCAARRPIASTAATRDRATISAGAYRRVYDAGRSVLREAGFALARRDYRFGQITTRPMGSPTLLEPWRDQNATWSQAAASTLQDLRRRVTLSLTPALGSSAPGSSTSKGPATARGESTKSPYQRSVGAGGSPSASSYQLRIKVVIERRQAPTRYLPNTDRPNAFAQLAAVPEPLAAQGVKPDHWAPVGRDRWMEQRLLDRILARSERKRSGR